MLYCQLGRAQSLREICNRLNSIQGKKNHLGIETPRKSTLAYANGHRPPELFETVFHRFAARVQNELGPKHRFRFKNKLLSLDTTTIDLCASIFDWAHFMRTNGAKLHMAVNPAGLLPVFCVITDGQGLRHPAGPGAQSTGGNDSGHRSRAVAPSSGALPLQ
jgi:hypothetical protein